MDGRLAHDLDQQEAPRTAAACNLEDRHTRSWLIIVRVFAHPPPLGFPETAGRRAVRAASRLVEVFSGGAEVAFPRSEPRPYGVSRGQWTERRGSDGGRRRRCRAAASLQLGRSFADRCDLCGNQILRRVRAESSRRSPRHRRDAAPWRAVVITAAPSREMQ